MKTSSTVLVLFSLLAFLPGTQGNAQTLPAPTPIAMSLRAQAPAVSAETADFLATLATAPSSAPSDLTPAPAFMTGCTTNAQCPTGTLCCYPCGIDGCTNMCITPLKGHCPHFP
jgi:hypothetical protein